MGYAVAKIAPVAGSDVRTTAAARIRELLAVEQEVIIECPACQTKFRVEASKLTQAQSSLSQSSLASASSKSAKVKARFHCSRCDQVFSEEISAGSSKESDSSYENSEQGTQSRFSGGLNSSQNRFSASNDEPSQNEPDDFGSKAEGRSFTDSESETTAT